MNISLDNLANLYILLILAILAISIFWNPKAPVPEKETGSPDCRGAKK
jgi:hypothetical protein